MEIEHKIVCGNRLRNTTTWIEPSNIVSIEVKYCLALDMSYTNVKTVDRHNYAVFAHKYREILKNHQKNQAAPDGEDQATQLFQPFEDKKSELFPVVGLITSGIATISIFSMYAVVEIPQVQNFYNYFLASKK